MPDKKPSDAASLQVIMTISGGVGDAIFKPKGIALTLIDYDVEGADENDPAISTDGDGRPCCVRQWGRDDEVIAERHWPLIREARKGSYARLWKCPDCGRRVCWSYEEMAEAGSPICTDCDAEMELL